MQELANVVSLIEIKETELRTKNNEMAEKENKITSLNSEIEILKKDLKEIQEHGSSELTSIQTRLIEVDAKCKNYEETLQKAKETHESEFGELKKENDSIKIDKEVVENELKAVKDLFSKLSDEREILLKQLDSMQQDNSSEQKIKDLSAEIENLKQSIREADEMLVLKIAVKFI